MFSGGVLSDLINLLVDVQPVRKKLVRISSCKPNSSTPLPTSSTSNAHPCSFFQPWSSFLQSKCILLVVVVAVVVIVQKLCSCRCCSCCRSSSGLVTQRLSVCLSVRPSFNTCTDYINANAYTQSEVVAVTIDA